MLIFNIFPRSFSTKNVVNLIEKVENTLRSKRKRAVVHQKETKLNEKGSFSIFQQSLATLIVVSMVA